MTARSLNTIAREIKTNWAHPHYAAKPYLDAMMDLDSMDDKFGADDAASIVVYFLSNAGSWRGDAAKRIKAELKAMLKK